MPPHESTNIIAEQHDTNDMFPHETFPRSLNRTEKEFLSRHSRVAAAVTFAQSSKPKAAVMQALQGALAHHQITFTRVDSSHHTLDWQRHESSLSVLPDLPIRESFLSAGAGANSNFSTGIPRSFLELKDLHDPLDITLIKRDAAPLGGVQGASDFVTGVIFNASRAVIDFAALVPLIEDFVQRLTSVQGSGIAPLAESDRVIAPSQLDKHGIKLLVGDRGIPDSLLPLDSEPAHDVPAAAAIAATRPPSEKELHHVDKKMDRLEEKELSDRRSVIKAEDKDLHHVFETEHKDFALVKDMRIKDLRAQAEIPHNRILVLEALVKSVTAVNNDEAKARNAIVEDAAQELELASNLWRDEAKTDKEKEKALNKQAKGVHKEQKELNSQEKKLGKMAEKRQKLLTKESDANRPGVPHAQTQQQAFRGLQDTLHTETVQLQNDEAELKELAATMHEFRAIRVRQADLMKSHAAWYRTENNALEKNKTTHFNTYIGGIKSQQGELQKEETKFTDEADLLYKEKKQHPKEHDKLIKQHLKEVEKNFDQNLTTTTHKHSDGGAVISHADQRSVKFLSASDVFDLPATKGAGSTAFVNLPSKTMHGISLGTQQEHQAEDRKTAFIAAAFAIAFMSQAHQRGLIRTHFEGGVHSRLGVAVAIAVDLRRHWHALQRGSEPNFPLQCTGFITIGVVFTEDELKRAIGFETNSVAAGHPTMANDGASNVAVANDDIASRFDLAAIASRVEADIHQRIERGEAHRQALGFVEGDSKMKPPQAAFLINNIGNLRESQGVNIEMCLLNESEADGALQSGGFSIIAWGSQSLGSARLALESDGKIDGLMLQRLCDSAQGSLSRI